ncbi:MAG: efflux RND transporter periplasmic adaptor subunit [Candidatus Latescibacterota bacterium]
MKRTLIIVGIAAALIAGVWYIRARRQNDAAPVFTFVEITRGALNYSVLSTGTLSPVGSVDIGTQVSGRIDRIFVDFNDAVKQGQVLAVLDTTLLAAAVRDAESELARSQAVYNAARSEYERNLKMYEKGYISELDLISFRTSMETAQADVRSARISLQRARTNLGFAVIRSPISGKVIFKSVEEGQTVAASLSTPTLFTVAEDLTRMEIHALVDESDIGKITVNQPVRFTVQAYLDKTFSGVVRQIRLQPSTVQNVVNYTVVADAVNQDDLLLPGMTATVEFVAEGEPGQLLIPNSALQFQPSGEVLEEYGRSVPEQRNRGAGSGQDRPRGGRPGSGLSGRSPLGNTEAAGAGRFWYLDESEKLVMKTVRIGDSDGRNTVILPGQGVQPGMRVIGGLAAQGQQGRGGGGVPFRRMF